MTRWFSNQRIASHISQYVSTDNDFKVGIPCKPDTLDFAERLSFQLSSLNNGRATLNFEPKPTPI